MLLAVIMSAAGPSVEFQSKPKTYHFSLNSYSILDTYYFAIDAGSYGFYFK